MSEIDGAQNRAQKRLFSDAYSLMASTAVSALAGVVTYFLSARLFTDEVVGHAAAMTAAMLLLSGIAQLDLSNALHRFLPTAGHNARKLLVGSYAAAAVVSLVLGLLYVAFFRHLLGDVGNTAFLWFTAAVVIWSIFNLQDQAFFGLGAAWAVPVDNTIHGLARIALLVAFVGGTASAIFATWIIPAGILVIVGWILVSSRLLPRYLQRTKGMESDYDRGTVIRFAAGGYIGNITAMALGNLLPLLVVAHLGAIENAHFYMAWTVASTVDLLVFNFGASLVVQGAMHAEYVPHLLRSALKKQAIIFIVPLLLLAVLAQPVLHIAFGKSYADAAHLMLTFLALGLIPRLIWGVYLPAVRLGGNVRAILLSQTLTNVAVLVATISGLYIGGLTGIGLGYLIAQIVIAAICAPKLFAMLKKGALVNQIDDVSVASQS